MTLLRSLLLSGFLLVLTASLQWESLCAANDDSGFRPLFNGKDLTGWVPVNTAPSTWSVKDGMLICTGKPIGELRTDRMYQNFVLELEWRHMVPKGNAGVFIWADDITARGAPFHRSIEVQVLENAYGNTNSHTTHGDIFPIHGAHMTPVNGRGGSRAFPTEERSHPSPEWNHYRIVCQDGDISLAVNGKVVTRGTECSPRKGYLCLESEGGVVHYRNLRIKERPDTPVDAQHIATADRGYRCLYTGIDLSGWKVAAGAASEWTSNDWVLSYTGDASDEDCSLTTTETLGDLGFVIDVKLSESSGTPRLRLRGSESAEIVIDPTDEAMAAHLSPTGQWNRLEGQLIGNRLTLDLNGHRLLDGKSCGDVAPTGPLVILPDGPLDISNPYVRPLTP